MKTDLAPKHSQKIGNSYVLWFQPSNSYLVVSLLTYQLLTYFFESDSKNRFSQTLITKFNFTTSQADAFYLELSDFLHNANSQNSKKCLSVEDFTASHSSITKTYKFWNAIITINYDSNKVIALLHPQFAHHTIDTESNSDYIFDITYANKSLLLFKNKTFIGSYQTKNIHVLLGQFAMELLNIIYLKQESEWMATFHASTITNGKEAVMLIGDSGNGKSTLSTLLMANGFDLLADDFTPILAENGHVYRYPSAISVKQGSFEVLQRLIPDFDKLKTQSNGLKKINLKFIPPNASFEASIKHLPCHKVVYVKYDANGKSELKESTAETILQTLIPDAWISPLAENSNLFLEWLQQLRFYELNYSNNEMAVSSFHSLFES